jgi:hypothetical protein
MKFTEEDILNMTAFEAKVVLLIELGETTQMLREAEGSDQKFEEAALNLYNNFINFQAAGFSRDEAFELIKNMVPQGVIT